MMDVYSIMYNMKKENKNQNNTVQNMISDLRERCDWPDEVDIPSQVSKLKEFYSTDPGLIYDHDAVGLEERYTNGGNDEVFASVYNIGGSEIYLVTYDDPVNRHKHWTRSEEKAYDIFAEEKSGVDKVSK